MQHDRLIITLSLLLLKCWTNVALAPSSKRVIKSWVNFDYTHHSRHFIKKLQTPAGHGHPIRIPSRLSSSIIPISPSSIIDSIFTSSQTVPLYLSLAINSSLFIALRAKLDKVLTPEGYMHALALGTMLWHCLGWKGWSVCVLYLVLGSLVTKIKFAEKQAKGIAEGREGRRGPENVWGSAATSLVMAAAYVQAASSFSSSTPPTGIFLGIPASLYVLAFTASLATKLADTFASEIGKAYGKTTFLITTFERVKPGTEGAISAEGTLAAFIGGSLLPFYALSIGLLPNINSVLIATVAAFFATNCESLIGATMQGKRGFDWMTNEVVNFFNTVIGAITAIAIASLVQ